MHNNDISNNHCNKIVSPVYYIVILIMIKIMIVNNNNNDDDNIAIPVDHTESMPLECRVKNTSFASLKRLTPNSLFLQRWEILCVEGLIKHHLPITRKTTVVVVLPLDLFLYAYVC